MNDLLLQFGTSNLCVSCGLAAIAWIMQSTMRRPVLAHLLWMLVLAKLVTPPLFTLPMLAVGTAEAAPALVALPAVAGDVGASTDTLGTVASSHEAVPIDVKTIVIALWLLGSGVVLVWSLVRILRFDRLLKMASKPAPGELQRRTDRLARGLLIARPPIVYLTSAQISPMVWWLGGRVRIYLPAALPQQMAATELRWILAHELAHIRRRDHLVRWLEWLACVAFWWNPIAWLARRNLRANEEVCCDALVLETFRPQPHTYANSLLSVVEFLATPALRPPAMASEINSGGFLERRFRMIVAKTPVTKTPRWLQAATLLFTMAVMPLGIAYAQDPDVGAVSKRLRAAVQAGELTPVQARTMLRALRQQDKPDVARQNPLADKRDAKQRKERTKQAKADAARLKQRLGAAIESGRVTEDEAAKIFAERMAASKKAAGKQKDATVAMDMDAIRKKLAAAVDAGSITREEAAAKLVKAALDGARSKAAKGKPADARLDDFRALRAAQESARADKATVRKHFVDLLQAGQDTSNARRLAERAKRDKQRAEAAARRTERRDRNEASRRRDRTDAAGLDARARQLRDAMQRRRDAGNPERPDVADPKAGSERSDREHKRANLERDARNLRRRELQQKLSASVESGDLTREQAAKKLAAIRKEMQGGENPLRGSDLPSRQRRLDLLEQQLEKSVESGELTEQDAKKKWREVMRKLEAAEKKAQRKAERQERQRKGKARERRSGIR